MRQWRFCVALKPYAEVYHQGARRVDPPQRAGKQNVRYFLTRLASSEKEFIFRESSADGNLNVTYTSHEACKDCAFFFLIAARARVDYPHLWVSIMFTAH